jgi:outer membrane protein assembly factor BamB
MKSQFLAGLFATAAATLAAAAGVAWWSAANPQKTIPNRVPGLDGAPTRNATPAVNEKIDIGSIFEKYDGIPPDSVKDSWPRFRGADSSNVAPKTAELADEWPSEGPEILWNVKLLGEGHAAPAVANGRVYIMDYDERKRADALRCISLSDGREIWRRGHKLKLKRNHGFSRTVAAVGNGVVVGIGPKCHVICADAETGDFKWGLDMPREFGAETPFWYTGQCPLIDGETVVLAPAGPETLMLGVQAATGKILWKTHNPGGWRMSHSSIMPVVFNGRKMYVYCALGGVAGVAADGEDAGEILWKTTAWNHSVEAPSPLHLGNGRFFVTAGYGSGGMTFQVGKNWKVKLIETHSPRKGLASEQQTPILLDGLVFGILPKDAGNMRTRLACFDKNDVTRPLWTSPVKFGLGPYLAADDKFFILKDNGTLVMARVSRAGYKELGRANIIPDGRDAWGPMALAGSKLLIRDLSRLYCLELAPK